MNKKFLSAILFGALVASAGSFVSCADNDGDIKELQDQNSELKAQLAQLKSELQAELKTAASASQVAAIEAKLSALEGVTSDNIAAVVAALKGDFSTQEAKVEALETQIKAIEAAQLDNASAVLEALNKAKENSSADMAALSALVGALDADVNVLVSALRGLVFQPEFYVDGIEAAEYTYLRLAPLDPKGDQFVSEKKAWSADSIDACIDINDKASISPKFVWQYAHRGDINTPVKPTTYIFTSTTGIHDAFYACSTDQCTYNSVKEGLSQFVPLDATKPIVSVGEKVLNTITFAMNPSNAKVTEKDLAFIVKNICAMTRANEAKLNVEKVATEDGMLTVTYWIADADIEKLITANHDESYGVLNQVENTTIVKLQAATSTENTVESDWAALYETSIQPIAIALNEAGKDWYAPIECSKDAKVYKELYKNPYEALYAPYTVAINYKSQGLDISKYIELHFLKADYEKANEDNATATGKHEHTPREIQHPHVTMSLADAAEKFGFTYEFSLVPYSIDDNITNPSSYAHMLSNGKEYIKDLGTAENAGSIIVPNTVDETKVTEQYVYIPKKLEDGSFEQGVSSVGKHPLVQVLVKSSKGHVILDGYVNLVIEREVESIVSPIFPLGEGRDCAGLNFATSWNQWSEILLEKTLGMSKLEFDEVYEPMEEPGHPGVYAQYNVTVVDGKVTSYTKVDYDKTYTEVTREEDPYGNTNHVVKLSLDKFDQEYIYDKADHTDVIYVAYKRKGSINHTVFQGVFIPLQFKISDVTKLDYSVKNVNFWYDKTGAPNILDSIGIENQSIRFNVNYGKDKINTFEYENGTNNMETFKAEGEASATEVLGFVRDLNDAWDGKALKFSKTGVYAKGTKPTYYFHPLTKTVKVTDEYSKTVYTLDVDNDFIDEDIWVSGDDPIKTTGVHKKTLCSAVSKEAVDYVKKIEGTHQVNTTKGIYVNTKLYALKTGESRSEANCIAEMNRYTGEVWYRYTDRSKAVLNATGHRVAEEYAYIGIFLPDACDDAYSINYNDIPENIFAAYWLRPLDIEPSDGDKVIDAVNNASYISIFDKYNFKDWRDYPIVDKSQSPMDYKNVWLLAFYGVKSMTLHLDKVTTDMNGHDITKDLLTAVNSDIKISYVEHNKTTEIGKLGAAATKPIDLNKSGYNKESMGVKSTYDAIVDLFGYLKYENKGANVSNFKFIVPVTFGYDWGEITTNFEVSVIGTEGNHDGE